LAQDTKTLAHFALGDTDNLAICINGVNTKLRPEYPPLAVLVMDVMSWKPLLDFDEIGALMDSYRVGDGFIQPYEDEEKESVDQAIAALQSGIDRLRAYEAERLKAQP
jgi:hypothetical protein